MPLRSQGYCVVGRVERHPQLSLATREEDRASQGQPKGKATLWFHGALGSVWVVVVVVVVVVAVAVFPKTYAVALIPTASMGKERIVPRISAFILHTVPTLSGFGVPGRRGVSALPRLRTSGFVLVSRGHCNRLPQTEGRKITDIYSLQVPEAASLRSSCLQGHAPPEALGK